MTDAPIIHEETLKDLQLHVQWRPSASGMRFKAFYCENGEVVTDDAHVTDFGAIATSGVMTSSARLRHAQFDSIQSLRRWAAYYAYLYRKGYELIRDLVDANVDQLKFK